MFLRFDSLLCYAQAMQLSPAMQYHQISTNEQNSKLKTFNKNAEQTQCENLMWTWTVRTVFIDEKYTCAHTHRFIVRIQNEAPQHTTYT